jgi:hypothetical protein
MPEPWREPVWSVQRRAARGIPGAVARARPDDGTSAMSKFERVVRAVYAFSDLPEAEVRELLRELD